MLRALRLQGRLGSLVCAGVFLGLIYAPLVDQLVRPSEVRDSRQEYRMPAKRPALALDIPALKAYPKAFESWYDDTFGLRDVLLRWHSMVRWYVVGSSPSTRIVLGDKGWIFSRTNEALEDHRGALPMSTGELELWRVFLERRRDWLAQRGIDFQFAVVPNKNQIYAELVPPRFAPVGPTRLDRLEAWLAERSDLRLLDLRPVLRAERAHDQGDDLTYYPLGTHWTARGAYAGYRALVESLAGRLDLGPPLERSAFDVERLVDEGDTWSERLYMRDLLHQAHLEWTLREPHARLVEGEAGGANVRYQRPDAPQLPKALFLHDSFGAPLRGWLAEHFSELICHWTNEFDLEEVQREHPQIVIQLYSEHTLITIVPQPTPLEDEGATAAQFAACPEVLWRFDGTLAESGLAADSKLALADGALSMARQRPDELLYLPDLQYPRDRTLLLCVDVDAPAAGPLQVFYQTEDLRTYDRGRVLQGRLAAGASKVFFVLPPMGIAGRLALRIGSDAGTYRLNGIEIRVASS